MKSASTGSDDASEANAHHGQPASRPCTSGYTSRSKPTDAMPTPPKSSRGAEGERDSRTTRAVAIRARIPAGRLTRKIGRQAAQRRRQRKARHAEHEHPFAAEDIAQAPARDQADRVGQSIPGDHELDLRERRAQAALDCWDRDVDNEEIQHAEKGSGEN